MNKIETFSEIKSGKLHIINRKKFMEAVSTLKDGRYSLTVERKYRKRSNPQNSFYWVVCVPLVIEGLIDLGFIGIDKESTHDLLKYKFLKKEIVSEHGEVIESVGSTAKLTTTEFMELISDITKWALEYLNVTIPEPGSQTELMFKD
jgi:hypothetical protein